MMLSIKPISTKLIDYYSNLGFAENHDYYSEDGVRPGMWWGEGAASLGLEGVVSPDVFENVLSGRSPDGGKYLVQQNGTANKTRRAGFDLTYTVPKSVSVLWSQLPGEDRAILDEVSMRALHRSLEAYVELCGVARRGKDGHTLEDAKPVVAVFSHDTARAVPGEAPDPNRHFHAIVANVCIRPDGTTGAIDSRILFQKRMKMALGAMFRAELAKLLSEEVGVEVYRPERGRKKKLASWWEIRGVPESVITAFSKRRQQIERWLKAHGLTGATASEKAALATREGKHSHAWNELNSAWEKLGHEFGFGRSEAQALLSTNLSKSAKSPNQIASEAIAELCKTKARFTLNEILEATAVLAQTEDSGIDGILSSVRHVLSNSEEIVQLEDRAGVSAFTTTEMIEVEKSLVSLAVRLAGSRDHGVSAQTVEQAIAEAETIRPQQAGLVRAIASGGDLAAVTGYAGTGKTFALGVARKALERGGFSVVGTALASKAAKGLERGAGISSTHIHSLLDQIRRGHLHVSEKTVLVVDEAGMVGTRQLHAILEIADRSGAKVVLVGDHRQLQAIDAGSPFRLIGERIGCAELTQIVRQREQWSRETVRNFRDGEADKALAALLERGRLNLSEHRDAAIGQLLSDWVSLLASGKGTLSDTAIFAGTNLEVEDLNSRAQAHLKSSGQLGEYSIELNGSAFHLGDRIVVTKNSRMLSLQNGTLCEVVGIWERTLEVKTEDGLIIEIDTTEFDEIELAYAMNGYKGQGVTVENALVLTGDSTTDREMAYVTASRAKGMTLVYSDEESVADIGELARRMSESNQKEMAIEHLVQEA